jgi:excisionase family DNA binding protein
MVILASPDVVCNVQQLAGVLGITTRHTERLIAEGVFKKMRSTKLRGRHYRLSDSVRAYVRYQREVLKAQHRNGSNGEYDTARAKRMAAMASMAELELKAKQGFYFRRDDLDFHITQMITACRQRLLAVPSRVMHQLVGVTDARRANQIVDDDIRLALTEFSEGKWKQTIEFLEAEAAYLRSQGLSDDNIEKMQDRERRRELNGEEEP